MLMQEARFSVQKWSEKKNANKEIIRKEYVCFKQGKGSLIKDAEKSRRRVVAKSGNGKFAVTIFVEVNNHTLSTPRKTHLLRSHREVLSAQKCLSQQFSTVNIPTHQQYNFLGVQAGGFENIGCIQKDLYNYQRDVCKELKGHDAEMFREYLKSEEEKNPSFTYTIDVDDEQRICRVFWADATSRRDYALYGDVVVFDTTYNTNRYKLILAPLMGVNNYGQTIIFGCAFLSDETIPSFVWLFKQFLQAMPGDALKMIITYQDPAITNAIAQTLPKTFHRYCSWHILNKFSEKLDAVKYSVYYKKFYNCIWHSKSQEEFDLIWLDLVQKSGLQDNKWLESMFQIRLKWKYVQEENSLLDFMVQFDRGLQKQRQEALIADNKDVVEKPKLKMFHNILVQMVDIYTKEIFFKFQRELLDSFNYKFQIISETDTLRLYKTQRKNLETDKGRHVSYEKDLDHVSCSCNKFESMGIPCRHILAYLHKYTDFEKIADEYILKRWSKSTKSKTVIDHGGMEIVDDRTYFLERSRLNQCCLGVVNKALTSEEAKQILIDALSSAEEKINLLIASSGSEKKDNYTVDYSTSGKRKKMVDCVTDVEMTEQANCYREPNQARAKGCGKRFKGGKEKATGSGKKFDGRLCKGCNQRGVRHDIRTCPKLAGVSLSQP
ncbi:LOW QUALITY PROTEIN: hypothetical protein AQUCO_05000035v1 [Aquilegia coerulea]|uniref:SWIM-type domain-containing protein n=1 Tax=Aquilegia coerulea TaxID=218851 RepID=A0A2G5CKK0_AQUCA|nr:LOW QUALITY PROTEIN: hypothetical protein AQUCO_05000035v1 [Aquilegia coerulea]